MNQLYRFTPDVGADYVQSVIKKQETHCVKVVVKTRK